MVEFDHGRQFLDANNQGPTSGAIAAINYVTLMRQHSGVNVRVINASWGGSDYSHALRSEIAEAGQAGILFVAAAGNGDVLGRGMDNDETPFYPASYDVDTIVAVAASDQNDKLARFSNYGSTSVDLAAPGVGIMSTEPGATYASRNGTSMAAPHVTAPPRSSGRRSRMPPRPKSAPRSCWEPTRSPTWPAKWPAVAGSTPTAP